MISQIKNLGIEIENPSVFAEGSLNYVFRGRHDSQDVVLKIFNCRSGECEKRFSNELFILKNYPQFKTPVLVDYSASDHWIMYQFVEGHSLNDDPTKANVGSLVDAVKNIHSFDVNFSEDLKQRYLTDLVENLRGKMKNSGVDRPLFNSIIQGIKYLEREIPHHTRGGLCRVNGDLNGGNVILDDSGEVRSIVDWEFSHIGDKYLDIAHFTNRRDDFDEDFLERYFGKELDPGAYNFFLVYFLLKVSLNNSPNNLEKMAFERDKKVKIVEDKSKLLMEMF